MKIANFLAGIVAMVIIAGCAATMPNPGTDQAAAADQCQGYAYQQDKGLWAWGMLGPLGAAVAESKARDTAEYRACMAHAGYGSQS